MHQRQSMDPNILTHSWEYQLNRKSHYLHHLKVFQTLHLEFFHIITLFHCNFSDKDLFYFYKTKNINGEKSKSS